MDKNQYIVVFEIGSSKIVGAVAEKSSAGMVIMLLFQIIIPLLSLLGAKK